MQHEPGHECANLGTQKNRKFRFKEILFPTSKTESNYVYISM